MNLSSKFHSLVFLFLFFSSCCLCAKEKPTWGAEFYEYYLILEMGEQKELKLDLKNLNKSKLIESSAEIRVVSDSFELWVDQKIPLSAIENDQWHGSIVMEAVFLGAAQCFVEIEWKTQNESMVERSINYVSVQIIRQKPPVWMYTKYYDTYEIVLYLVTRLLLGTALNWREVVLILEKPLCVTVSICSSILIMPMTGYILGFIIFPDDTHMQFVLLIIGACLTKGISNFWTVCLNGNTELSVTMSIVNALLTSGIIPLYLFTLGYIQLPQSKFQVPYPTIALYMFYTIFPLLVGIVIKCCIYRICSTHLKRFLGTILRFLSLLYLISITVYAILSVKDLLVPSAFGITWKFYLAGFLFPLCGFTISSLTIFVCKQESKDRFAIAAETINFNTFIALYISKSVLPGTTPQELATLLANLVVIMTPIPLFAQFIWTRCRKQKQMIQV